MVPSMKSAMFGLSSVFLLSGMLGSGTILGASAFGEKPTMESWSVGSTMDAVFQCQELLVPFHDGYGLSFERLTMNQEFNLENKSLFAVPTWQDFSNLNKDTDKQCSKSNNFDSFSDFIDSRAVSAIQQRLRVRNHQKGNSDLSKKIDKYIVDAVNGSGALSQFVSALFHSVGLPTKSVSNAESLSSDQYGIYSTIYGALLSRVYDEASLLDLENRYDGNGGKLTRQVMGDWESHIKTTENFNSHQFDERSIDATSYHVSFIQLPSKNSDKEPLTPSSTEASKSDEKPEEKPETDSDTKPKDPVPAKKLSRKKKILNAIAKPFKYIGRKVRSLVDKIRKKSTDKKTPKIETTSIIQRAKQRVKNFLNAIRRKPRSPSKVEAVVSVPDDNATESEPAPTSEAESTNTLVATGEAETDNLESANPPPATKNINALPKEFDAEDAEISTDASETPKTPTPDEDQDEADEKTEEEEKEEKEPDETETPQELLKVPKLPPKLATTTQLAKPGPTALPRKLPVAT